MKELGGFFEMELSMGEHLHSTAIKLKSGRACLKYIVRLRSYSKIFIPFYICNSVIEAIKSENIEYDFYQLDDNFLPKLNAVKENECILYVNYFGLFDNNVIHLTNIYKNIIVDNTQSFFSRPLSNVDTFYSARKFFGVSDGAYLYIDQTLDEEFVQDISYNRMLHLMKRIDVSASEAYGIYKENEEEFEKDLSIKYMSNLTDRILRSIDYENAISKRKNNFKLLHSKFHKLNQLSFTPTEGIPMTYPLLLKSPILKDKLISKNLFIPTYWPEVTSRVSKDSFEWQLCNNLLPLPIDQRYSLNDMLYMIEIIEGEL